MSAAAGAGVDWVQLRERELSASALLALADAIAHRSAVRLVVNRRLDVALALRDAGVHLGFDAVAPETARRLLGAERLVGVSAHSAAEVRNAAKAGASYAFLAPIFAPRSKPGARPTLGLAALSEAAAAGIPVLAQGGCDATNAASLIAAGAAGIAVTGAILMADDPGAEAARIRAALDAALSPGG